ncbi:MAG: hypothetical protein HYT13_02575 [Candidatus Liptonbacteria bacterium]|nr:hypothetical protein [Candidatus Liptonbacteria bacterium]
MSELGQPVPDKTRFTLDERLDEIFEWVLSCELFGEGLDVDDFQEDNYTYFLDHVTSKEELVRGLRELSPLLDDALDVAEQMDDKAFTEFKLALKRERDDMPSRYLVLLIPKRFLEAMLIAKEFKVCLGVCMIRIMEDELNTQPPSL